MALTFAQNYVFGRALPDITSIPEVRQNFKIQTVRKPDVFLPGCQTYNIFAVKRHTQCITTALGILIFGTDVRKNFGPSYFVTALACCMYLLNLDHFELSSLLDVPGLMKVYDLPDLLNL